MAKIRQFKIEDVDKYFEICTSSGDIARYVPGLVEDTQSLCNTLVQGFASANFVDELAFAIVDEMDSLIGAIVASREYACNSINASYFIGGPYRRKGYAKKALETFIEYCKNNTSYWSIYFDIVPSNIASATLVKSFGAEAVGELYYLDRFIRYELVL